jgi:hypothetical protein
MFTSSTVVIPLRVSKVKMDYFYTMPMVVNATEKEVSVLMSRYSCMRQSAGKHTVHLHGECKCR